MSILENKVRSLFLAGKYKPNPIVFTLRKNELSSHIRQPGFKMEGKSYPSWAVIRQVFPIDRVDYIQLL